MRVVPVAGRDSMLLNLSGAHGPYFTRNIVLLKDSAGRTGVGEVSRRRRHPPDAGGCAAAGGGPVPSARSTASSTACASALPTATARGRGLQTFDLRITIHAVDRGGSGAARSSRAVPRRSGRSSPRRRPAARRGGDAGLPLLHRRPDQDGPGLSHRARRRGTTGCRLRNEEAMTPAAVVRLAEAAQARYGFNDFKLKGGVLAGRGGDRGGHRLGRAVSGRTHHA